MNRGPQERLQANSGRGSRGVFEIGFVRARYSGGSRVLELRRDRRPHAKLDRSRAERGRKTMAANMSLGSVDPDIGGARPSLGAQPSTQGDSPLGPGNLVTLGPRSSTVPI